MRNVDTSLIINLTQNNNGDHLQVVYTSRFQEWEWSDPFGVQLM
jgi:hypothetical protein